MKKNEKITYFMTALSESEKKRSPNLTCINFF